MPDPRRDRIERKPQRYDIPERPAPGLGVQHGNPAVTGGWNQFGESMSNPLAGPPPMEDRGTGGMARPKLMSLYAPEHAAGAKDAVRPAVLNPLKDVAPPRRTQRGTR